MSTTQRKSRFHVGDRVRIDFGLRKLTGVIVEDVGPLGIGGRHLFQVDVPMDPFDPWSVRLQEDEIEALPPGSEVDKPLEKQKVVEYLVNGGLISILRSNLEGGKNQPRVWLCRDQLGNITHTFIEERGLLGGQLVPSLALRGHKVFTPKRDAVLSFVESFGLNRHDAEKVVAEVGTAP